MATASTPTSQPPVKKSTWDTIITMTPVVMTVIATVLAGLSSSEMTKAQYHRSVAAQNQSKVGDQWGFFQAKRIRGTQMEISSELLPITARPGPLSPELVRTCATRLTRLLNEAQTRAVALETASDKNVADAAKAFVAEVNKAKLGDFLKSLNTDLEKSKDVFRYLGTTELPKPDPKDPATNDPTLKEAAEDPRIKEAVKAIEERQPEGKIAENVRGIKKETIRLAIEAAERQGTAFDKASKPVEDSLKALNKIVRGPIRLASLYHTFVVAVEPTPGPNATTGGGPMDKALKAATDLDSPVSSAANELNNLIKGAQLDYDARRYRFEARTNQNTANLYELNVHRSSAESDSHLKRSSFFFFGMLAAQCGVAIGSISLAARQKSLLWALAAVAGVGAIAFSAWVYLSF